MWPLQVNGICLSIKTDGNRQLLRLVCEAAEIALGEIVLVAKITGGKNAVKVVKPNYHKFNFLSFCSIMICDFTNFIKKHKFCMKFIKQAALKH